MNCYLKNEQQGIVEVQISYRMKKRNVLASKLRLVKIFLKLKKIEKHKNKKQKLKNYASHKKFFLRSNSFSFCIGFN